MIEVVKFIVNDGRLTLTPTYTWPAYAGYGEGRNDPRYEHVRNVGPIPRGRYALKRHWRDRAGPNTLACEPVPGTNLYGRSGFLIHGDNATGTASKGCIVVAPDARRHIARLVDAGRVWLDVIGWDPLAKHGAGPGPFGVPDAELIA